MRYIIAISTALFVAFLLAADITAAQDDQPMTTLKIMPLGDSITAGFDNGLVLNGYRGQLYTILKARGVDFDFVGRNNFTDGTLPDADNEGWLGAVAVSGDGYSLDGLLAAAMAANPPDIILLQVGTNDMTDVPVVGVPRDSAKAPGNLLTLLAHISAINPNVLTLVSTIPPRTDVPAYGANVPGYNAALPGIVRLRRAAGQKVVLVNVGGQLVAADVVLDGIHPTASGYAKLGTAWGRALVDALATPTEIIATSPLTNDRLFVGVTARGSAATLSGVTFGTRTNMNAVADLTLGDGAASFTAVRTTSGQPARLAFTVTDSVGSWAASLGGGAAGALSAAPGARV